MYEVLDASPLPSSDSHLWEKGQIGRNAASSNDFGVNFVPTDDLYADQWHFDLLGNGRGRASIETIWNDYSGAGVHVGVYDSGVQSIHYDLDGNYDASRHVIVGGVALSGDPVANPLWDDFHGTAVAGIIAAENNGVGAVGIAWGSSLTSVNIFDVNSAAYINASNITGFLEAVHQMANFDVTNNSWGGLPGYFYGDSLANPAGFDALVTAEYQYAAINGRGGLGTNIVQSAGNDNLDSNGSGINASRYTITVNALLETGYAASYSSFGANTLVSAAGGDTFTSFPSTVDGTRLVTTTDLLGTEGPGTIADLFGDQDFTDIMNGTSAAAPMVSGVITLMLEANSNLGWRDVQTILAATAFHTGSAVGTSSPGLNEDHLWFFNGAGNWNNGGMHFSEDYGYGNIDVFGAVRMAEAYAIIGNAPSTSANEASASTGTMITSIAPPDGSPNDPVSYSFSFAQNLSIEHIALSLQINHSYVSDLEIILVSPDGTEVTVQTANIWTGGVLSNQVWIYGIEALRGELSAGTWTLKVSDKHSLDSGTINSVEMTVYGSTPSVDDIYHYTDEIFWAAALDSSRTVLSDTNGGVDWLNFAQVSGTLKADLATRTVTLNGMVMFTIDPGTVIENIIGGDGNDALIGNSGVNRLYGGRGNDVLDGGAGADYMAGGVGNDTYIVGDTADVTFEKAGEGIDTVLSYINWTLSDHVERLELRGSALNATGNALNNTLVGTAGNNILNGGAGDDYMVGGAGDDIYIVGSIGDQTIELADGGTDTVRAWIHWTLGANIERLELQGTTDLNGTGNALNNTLVGNAGNNILNGGAGDDYMVGGAGDDIYVVGSTGDQTIEFVGGGTDTVRAWIHWTLGANIERLELQGTGNLNGTGNALNNTLVGNAGNNLLNGGAGDDYMVGGAGDDIYIVGSLGDKTIELAGGGIDTVRSYITWTLADNVERLELLGTDNLNGTGNSLKNTLVGNAGNNLLNGGAGDDYMVGGAGDDIYIVASAGDQTIELAGGGTDTVRSYITWTLAANVERLELLGTDNLNGTGNSLNNTLVGNAGNNDLSGGAGNDYLSGGAGNDTLIGGAGNDTLVGGAGEDRFLFNATLNAATNVDTILDFSVLDDTILLENAIFAKLTTTGTLNSGFFRVGSAAADADDYIIYNNSTGALFYDADGNGAGAAIQFAKLSAGLALTHDNFVVV